MIKKTAVALALVLAVGCASSPMTSSSNDSSAALAGVATRAADAPEYILLSAPSQVRNVDYSKSIYGFHIKGTMTNRGFLPAGTVQGKGTFCAEGKDVLSLIDLKVYKAGAATPAAPYLLGCATDNGFQPASRDIVVQ